MVRGGGLCRPEFTAMRISKPEALGALFTGASFSCRCTCDLDWPSTRDDAVDAASFVTSFNKYLQRTLTRPDCLSLARPLFSHFHNVDLHKSTTNGSDMEKRFISQRSVVFNAGKMELCNCRINFSVIG
jgi:hypothetical protein